MYVAINVVYLAGLYTFRIAAKYGLVCTDGIYSETATEKQGFRLI